MIITRKAILPIVLLTTTLLSLPALAGPMDRDRGSNYIRFDGGGLLGNKIHGNYGVSGYSGLPNIVPVVDEHKGDHAKYVMNAGLGAYLSPVLRADVVYSRYGEQKRRAISTSYTSVPAPTTPGGSPTPTATSAPTITTNVAKIHYKVQSQSVLLNLYYDIKQFDKVTPYLTAGIGFSRNVSKAAKITGTPTGYIAQKSNDSLAFAGGGGLSFKLSSDWDLDVSYRYTDLGTVLTGKSITLGSTAYAYPEEKGRITNHAIMAGLRFSM